MKQKILIFLLIAFSLFAKEQIAVIDFSPKGVDTTDAQVLSERLAAELFLTDSFTLVEREMMREILKEQGFQKSGCVDESCIVEAGRVIGVKQVVGGSISRLGKTYSVSARLINVETGKVLQSITYDNSGEIDELLPAMRIVARRLAGIEPVPEPPVQQIVSPAPAPVPAPPVASLTVPNDSVHLVPIQISFISPIALFPQNYDVLGFSWNILYGKKHNVMGIDAGLINHVSGTMLGIQSGKINISENCFGFQGGVVNKTEHGIAVIQAGAINLIGSGSGIQLGFINVCDQISGIQIGLINLIRNGYGMPFCPIINVGFGGPAK